MSRFRAAGIDTGTALDPLELARSCHDPTQSLRSRAVVSELVALSATDEVAGLAALVALRPGLLRIVGRLAARGVARDDAETDVVASAWEIMGSVASEGAHPRVAQRVISATWERCRRASRRASPGRSASGHAVWGGSTKCRELALLDGFDVEALDANPADRVSTILWEARRAGAVSARQATLVHDTRVLDIGIAAVAAEQGRTTVAVRKDRERVEARLRAVIDNPAGNEDVGTGSRGMEVIR